MSLADIRARLEAAGPERWVGNEYSDAIYFEEGYQDDPTQVCDYAGEAFVEWAVHAHNEDMAKLLAVAEAALIFTRKCVVNEQFKAGQTVVPFQYLCVALAALDSPEARPE